MTITVDFGKKMKFFADNRMKDSSGTPIVKASIIGIWKRFDDKKRSSKPPCRPGADGFIGSRTERSWVAKKILSNVFKDKLLF